MNVWWIVGLAVVVVLTAILVFRLHAFLTLLLAGLLVAVLTSHESLRRYTDFQVDRGNMTADAAKKLADSSPPERLAASFGETAGKIGILIALASIIGQCLLESGAAATIVDRMLRWTGPRRAPEALAASSFVLGIPVFFDTVFYLMVPLARSLRRQLGKDYVLFILAILAGGSIAHSLVPPTPGPLLVAGIIDIDLGTMMVAGLVIGGCSSVLSLAAARLINLFVEVPMRLDPADADAVDDDAAMKDPDSDPPEASDRRAPSQASPSLFRSLIPIVVPVILIAVGSVASYLAAQDRKLQQEQASIQVASDQEPDALPIEETDLETNPGASNGKEQNADMGDADMGDADKVEQVGGRTIVLNILRGLGNKNIALAIGVVLALSLVRYCPQEKRPTLVTRSLASGGNIILITAAGGAFGAMLRQAGIEQAVGGLAEEVPAVMILPVAFAVTAGIRTLQGSATVAMITAAGVLQGIALSEELPFHPVYLAMAIGAGSKPVSWMTDSAFWVITRMSGMTEAEGLRTLTPMSFCMGISALLFTVLFAWLYPAI